MVCDCAGFESQEIDIVFINPPAYRIARNTLVDYIRTEADAGACGDSIQRCDERGAGDAS